MLFVFDDTIAKWSLK